MKHTWISRAASTLLCSLLLAAVLTACGQQGEQATEGTDTGTDVTTNTQTADFKIAVEEYALIRPDGAAQSAVDAAVLLNKTVTEKLGKQFKSFTDDFVRDESQIDDAAYEILIGDTNRPQSAEAMKDVTYGYVITKIGNKIVINASTSSLLTDAVSEFIETYLSTAVNGVISIPENLYISNTSEGSLTVLNEKGKSNFTLIFSDSLDNTKGDAESKDRYDYVVNCAMDFRNEFMRKFKNVNLPLSTDWVKKNTTPDSSTYEILVGDTNRPETATFRKTLAVNEYGFGVVGNKIVITGWSDLTIGMALDLFISNMNNFQFTDANGNANMILAADTRVTKTFDSWNVDIPAYDGGVFSGVMEGTDSCYEIYMTETTAAEFKAYRAKLEAAGYKLHQENEDSGNLFATYYNDKNMIHTYYVDYQKSVRIITESMKTCNLPANEDPYTKITDTTFTMMDLDNAAGNFGNAFIITLEDGSFIVHDGGGDAGGKDRQELYNLMTKLNKRKDGKIVIAAWIISHEHWDHFKNFRDFCDTYSSTVVLEQVVYNVARPTINYNSNNPGAYVANGSLKGLSIFTKCKLVKFHTGQTLQVRNLKIECVYTQEDIYPQKLHIFNNSSMVTRFSIDGQRFTILGDIQAQASDILVKMYGDSLKTDILQVAHHGYDGATTAVYNKFKPTVLMWPTDISSFNLQTAGTSSNNPYVVDYALSKQPNVKLIVVADQGHKTVSLPIKDFTDQAVTVLPVTRK